MDTSTSSTSNRSRQQNQEDAMKKLTGEDMQTRIRHALQPSAAPPSGTSLAAFMGGKASAPRLTRHAPQQDAHDPTQFEQRTHVAAPHPVFGRGGIALPGMTAYSGRNAISTSPPSQVSGSSSHSDAEFTHHRDRKTSTPSGVRAIVAKAEEMRSSTSHKVPQPQDIGVRQRTMSTPTGSYPARSPNLPTQQSKAEESQSGRYTPRAISRSPAPLSQSPAPPSSRTPVPPSISPAPPSRSPAPLSPSVPLRPTTPQERRKSFENSTSVRTPHSPLPPRSPGIPASSQCSSPSLAKQPVTTPSLSHPVQPQQKPVFNGPKLPAASSTSVAFLKPPVEKEPTPSISRLQGRGFVQNMVKASSQLSSGSTLEGSPIPRQATSTPDTGKKTPVLDRWQFDNGRGAGSPSPPIISPKPVPIRKSRTLDPSQSLSPSSPVPTPFHSESSGRYLKSTSSLPSIAQPRTPDPSSTRMSSSKSDVGAITPSARPKTPAGANGTRWTSSKSDVGVVSPSSRPKTPAGSSTTLISYIKPTKTGDSPPTTSSPATPAPTSKATSAPPPAVDEMGVRVRPRSKSISAEASEEGHVKAPSANGDSGGKPLAHVRSFW
ncbi:hypothetical protein BXZ70DRAFT_35210 [Cristinia sonorae]|uniref:Uncharacterized protein n=1 Tax=Cristinia sonorae TaxID=1940300 RepID=A0A8K0V077_9AGAR|nr:hypothetical protein BXZ70DRAFT_35210 [Cristinia sonorae]